MFLPILRGIVLIEKSCPALFQMNFERLDYTRTKTQIPAKHFPLSSFVFPVTLIAFHE